MNILCRLILLIFITFISSPTIINFIDKGVDTSNFYTMCEEEENHLPFNEIKTLPIVNFSFFSLTLNSLKTLNVLIEHNLSFTNLAHQIFSPPPNNL